MISNHDANRPITSVIVDDDKNTATVFSELLELYDIKVIGIGHGGNEAVEMYNKLHPDLMFLDVMMFPTDGISALEQIRKKDSDSIIIMVTADLTSETNNKLRELNTSAIIYKPFKQYDLFSTIENLINVKRGNTCTTSIKNKVKA